jgi:hypothetical protein
MFWADGDDKRLGLTPQFRLDAFVLLWKHEVPPLGWWLPERRLLKPGVMAQLLQSEVYAPLHGAERQAEAGSCPPGAKSSGRYPVRGPRRRARCQPLSAGERVGGAGVVVVEGPEGAAHSYCSHQGEHDLVSEA